MHEFSVTFRASGPEPQNEITIYNQAKGFYFAGNRSMLNIYTGPKTMQSLPIPAVVNFVFSIELFIKAQIVKQNKQPRKTHLIKELIQDCDQDFLNHVRSEFEKTYTNPNFDMMLEIVNEMFHQVRYLYEFDVNIMYESAVQMLAQSFYQISELEYQ